MSYHKGLSEWTDTVTSHMGHLSKPQAVVLAMWSFGMAIMGHYLVCMDMASTGSMSRFRRKKS